MRRKVKRQLRKKPEQKKRKLSAVDRQNILNLADSFGELIPLSGYKSNFTLIKVARAHGLSKYLPLKTANKKEAISKFLENLLVYRPRTLTKLVREILPLSIAKRHGNGKPILLDEATLLADRLALVGCRMKKEILQLQFPKDMPAVVPPPIELQTMLKNFHLHPILMPDCQKMFIDGHLNESVRKALEKFEATVQKISGLQEIGADLLGKAFNEKAPKIELSDLSGTSEVNEQEGFKLMTMGMMRGWRNNLSHGNESQITPHEAFGRLVFVSNLFHRLDTRKAP